MAITPQINNQISATTDNQTILPSKTYKINNTITSTDIKFENTTTVEGNEINIDNAAYYQGELDIRVKGATYQQTREYSADNIKGYDIKITDANEEYPAKIEISGNSEQDGEPSPENLVEVKSCGDNVNLLNESTLIAQTNLGVTSKFENNKIILEGASTATGIVNQTLKVTLDKGTYAFNYIGNCQYPYFTLRSATGTYIQNLYQYNNLSNNNQIITVDEDNSTFIIALHSNVGTTHTEENSSFNLVITKGKNIPSTYSPYRQGSINEVVCNKNLFDKNSLIINTVISRNTGVATTSSSSNYEPYNATQFIKIKEKTNYYINFTYTSTNYGWCFYNKNKEFISSLTPTVNTFVSPEKACYLRFCYNKNNIDTNTIQLEEGSTATNYVEHQEQTITIPVQQPFRKIGDYADTFIKKDGKRYERHWINRVIFDGTEIWTIQSLNLYVVDNILPNHITTNNIIGIQSNYYLGTQTRPTNSDFLNFVSNYDFACCLHPNGTTIRFKDTRDLDITTFKNYLSEQYNAGTPVYIDYVLSEPIDIECTEEQTIILDKLEKTTIYEELTYIYSTDEVKPMLDVDYNILYAMPSVEAPSPLVGLMQATINQKNSSELNTYEYNLKKPLYKINETTYDLLKKDTIVRNIGYIESYKGEEVGNEWLSSTGELSTGATVIYKLTNPIVENIDNKLNNFKVFIGTNNITIQTDIDTNANLKLTYYSKNNISIRTIESDRIIGFVDNLEAIKQAIYHILSTERYAYLIYDNNYGVELEQYIGKDLNYIEATIEDTLKEALTYDLRITNVTVNEISKASVDNVLINFTVNTTYGDLVMEVNVNV